MLQTRQYLNQCSTNPGDLWISGRPLIAALYLDQYYTLILSNQFCRILHAFKRIYMWQLYSAYIIYMMLLYWRYKIKLICATAIKKDCYRLHRVFFWPADSAELCFLVFTFSCRKIIFIQYWRWLVPQTAFQFETAVSYVQKSWIQRKVKVGLRLAVTVWIIYKLHINSQPTW